jgi:formate dehydrogenase major subunit
LADEPGYAHISPKDAAARGIQQDDLDLGIFSRRGKIITRAFVDDRTNEGASLHDVSMVGRQMQRR